MSNNKENLSKLSSRISKIRSTYCEGSNELFSEKIHVNKSYCSGICAGSKTAGQETLDKILDAFPEVSRSWLVLGEGSMIAKPKAIIVTNEDGHVSTMGDASAIADTIHNIHSTGNNNVNSIGNADTIAKMYEDRLADKQQMIDALRQQVDHLNTEISELRQWTKLCAERYLSLLDKINATTKDNNDILRELKSIGFKKN